MNKKDIERRLDLKTQLGMDPGTASSRLKKELMFSLIVELKRNTCYRCNELILNSNELSVEHKEEWLGKDNASTLFFDLDNIAFSHLQCNIKACRKPHKIVSLQDPRIIHGSRRAYEKHKCRCSSCKEWKKDRNSKRYI